jgi:hypothetical protein
MYGQLDLTKAELGRMKLRNLLSNANAHLVAMVRRQRGAAPVHNADPEKEQDASLQFISLGTAPVPLPAFDHHRHEEGPRLRPTSVQGPTA